MKSYKLFAGIVFFLLLLSATSSQAYAPNDQGFVQAFLYMTQTNPNNVVANQPVNMSIVVTNLTNETIHNVTITQTLLQNTQLIGVGDQKITPDTANFTNLVIPDTLSGSQLHLSYLNFTTTQLVPELSANFNITLPAGALFSFEFRLNFTKTGQFPFSAPVVSFYDHWGDKQTDVKTQNVSANVKESPVETRRKYIPTFTTSKTNYTLIIGGFIALLAVALLGRTLHFKAPVRL